MRYNPKNGLEQPIHLARRITRICSAVIFYLPSIGSFSFKVSKFIVPFVPSSISCPVEERKRERERERKKERQETFRSVRYENARIIEILSDRNPRADSYRLRRLDNEGTSDGSRAAKAQRTGWMLRRVEVNATDERIRIYVRGAREKKASMKVAGVGTTGPKRATN